MLTELLLSKGVEGLPASLSFMGRFGRGVSRTIRATRCKVEIHSGLSGEIVVTSGKEKDLAIKLIGSVGTMCYRYK